MNRQDVDYAEAGGSSEARTHLTREPDKLDCSEGSDKDGGNTETVLEGIAEEAGDI